VDEIQLIAQFPALAGLIVVLMWNRSLQERLDRMQERQNSLMDSLLKKTDIQE
jgi:hypothetical protein